MSDAELKNAARIVLDKLGECDLFCGKYDAANGNDNFMYGISTVMEVIAKYAEDEDFEPMFMKNLIDSEKSAKKKIAKERPCCNNCRKNLKLVKYDYSGDGCVHTDYDGHACLIFASEGLVVHMVGGDPDQDMCEEWSGKGVGDVDGVNNP